MSSSAPTALALTHVPFEDLGTIGPILIARGFSVRYAEATASPFPHDDLQDADLLVVLGGPIGVYDSREFPFLLDELAALRQRLEARKPTLGICLGAQLIAAALGARVYPGTNGSEIGWGPLNDVPAGSTPPAWFGQLLAPGVEVLHWHGDTFDLPAGAVRLASSKLYVNQAFVYGKCALAMQFHPEVTENGLERWYVGHTAELHAKGIDVVRLREEGVRKAPALAEASQSFFNDWFNYIL